ncbi:MAG: hypothetical protein WCF70_05905 [Dehalococcoidales bacterium]
MIVWIILAGVAVLLAAVYGTTWYLGKKRAQALQALAATLSFTFTARGDDMLIGELGEFHLFSQGYRRRISNVLQGKFNLVPITVMDYKYTTGPIPGLRPCWCSIPISCSCRVFYCARRICSIKSKALSGIKISTLTPRPSFPRNTCCAAKMKPPSGTRSMGAYCNITSSIPA